LISGSSLKFYGAAALVVIADQLTKAAARAGLQQGREVTVIPGFFDLKLSYNTGGAFGILPGWAPMLILIGLVLVFAVVRLRQLGPQGRSLSLGLALLLGGGVGNLIDRVFSPVHEVTDFISLYVRTGGQEHRWPTFNVADAAIVVGAVFVIYFVFIVKRRME